MKTVICLFYLIQGTAVWAQQTYTGNLLLYNGEGRVVADQSQSFTANIGPFNWLTLGASYGGSLSNWSYTAFSSGAISITGTLKLYDSQGKVVADQSQTFSADLSGISWLTNGQTYWGTIQNWSYTGPSSSPVPRPPLTSAQESYTTNFPRTENPISENGNWINGGAQGLAWSNVATVNGLAYGTQGGIDVNVYDDSTAVLTGNWPADQSAQAVISILKQDYFQPGNLFEEVELRLRTTISANSITGYEINASVLPDNPYIQVVVWPGPYGQFQQIAGADVAVHDGDTLTATIVGNVITVWVNSTQVIQVTDNTFASGSPGIGFFLENQTGLNADYGFSSFSASGL